MQFVKYFQTKPWCLRPLEVVILASYAMLLCTPGSTFYVELLENVCSCGGCGMHLSKMLAEGTLPSSMQKQNFKKMCTAGLPNPQ